MIRPYRVLGVLGAALIGFGCTGAIDGMNAAGTHGPTGSDPGKMPGTGPGGPGDKPVDPGKTGDETPPDPGAGSLDDSAAMPGPAPLRRMTLLEYKNTVRDLLGIKDSEVPVDGSFPPDLESSNSGFVTGSSFSTGDDARAFMKAADALGALAATKLGALLPCGATPAAGDQDACAKQFIVKFGLRAFRRPVSQLEADRLYAYYQDQKDPAKGGMKFEEAISSLVSAMLQTPYFLYHWELGPAKPSMDGALVRYNPYEMASRLSYMIWATMPDNDLLQQAANGGLTSPEQIEKAARRLLADDRAKAAVKDFHLQWLDIGELAGLDKDPSFTRYTATTADSMNLETQAFVDNLFFGPQATGSMKEMLTSHTSFINAELAKIYDVKNFSGTGDALVKTELDPTQRAGMLTLGSFLAVKSNPDGTLPPRRGHAVLNRVLCMDMQPPANLMVPPAAADDGMRTTRQRFEVHGQAACAKGCHNYIDPVGFAFENYDAIGAWRTTENMQPVNAASEVMVGKDKIAFTNAVDLMGKLANRPEVSECIATQWLRYGLRRIDDGGDKPSVVALQNGFKAKGYDMRELMVAVTKSRAFTHRSLSDGEVAQ
jgi:hypothetical protein